jgi:DNA-binding NarL/FixJ family response regulator
MSLEQAVAYAQQVVLDKQHCISNSGPAMDGTLASLSERELEVLRLVAMGLPDKAVAARLIISPRTVHAHLASIYGKLGINSRHAATRLAIEHRLVASFPPE